MKLYTYWRSSSAWRVRIGLALKNIEVELLPTHLLQDGGQQLTDAFLTRNPMGQVPVLSFDTDAGDTVNLTQSMAILHYLDEQYPEPPLLPADPVARAQARALAEIVNAGIQPLQNLAVLLKIQREGGDRKAWGAFYIEQGLLALERTAQATAGQFLVGDHVSLADICLIPQLYNARRFEVDLSPMPTLRRIEATCEHLDAFQRAHPDQQPDAVR